MSPPGGSSPRTPFDDTPDRTTTLVDQSRTDGRLRLEPPGEATAPGAAIRPGPAPPPVPPGRRRGRRRRRALVVEWLIVVALAVLLAFGLRSFAFQAFYVPSSSMVPTLRPGDRILVEKLFFHAGSLHEGDIIVFHTPPRAKTECETSDADLVKRVIGLPGERLYSIGNTIYVDGRPLPQPYLDGRLALGPAIGSPADPVVVPAGRYFVMGDDRSISCDSRYFGFVPGDTIVGRVVALVWRDNHPTVHIY